MLLSDSCTRVLCFASKKVKNEKEMLNLINCDVKVVAELVIGYNFTSVTLPRSTGIINGLVGGGGGSLLVCV
jgi:hypothetical protein